MTLPLADRRRQMRPAVERDHTHVVDHFADDDHVVARLHDLNVVVVERRHHRWSGSVGHLQTALGKREVLRPLGVVAILPLGLIPEPALRLRAQRRDAPIRRIGDERGAIPGQEASRHVSVEVACHIELEFWRVTSERYRSIELITLLVVSRLGVG
jgi:hypothetical protein